MPDRIYAPKPQQGAIERSLSVLPVGERQNQRARSMHAALGRAWPQSYQLDGYEVSIATRPTLYTVPSGTVVLRVARVTARVVGGAELPVDAGGYEFVNPPVKVHDGTWRQEADPISGQMMDVPNHAGRPVEAFQRIVLDAVLGYARAHGAAV